MAKKKPAMTKVEIQTEIANLFTQEEVAKLFKVTIKTVIAWNRIGVKGSTLPKIRIGRRAYYRPDDVHSFRRIISGGR